MKIVYLMPQVKTLDRHLVTVSERIKAKKLCEEEYGLTQGAGPVAVTKKSMVIKTKKGDGFSKGEKDLYREQRHIEKRFQNEKNAEMEKTRQYFEKKSYEGLPSPTMKTKNRLNFGQNTEDKLVEWEKNQVKEVFAIYDETMKAGVTKEELIEIMGKLMKDECIIGKVPALTDEEIPILFDHWEASEEGKYSWTQLRDGLNTFLWKM